MAFVVALIVIIIGLIMMQSEDNESRKKAEERDREIQIEKDRKSAQLADMRREIAAAKLISETTNLSSFGHVECWEIWSAWNFCLSQENPREFWSKYGRTACSFLACDSDAERLLLKEFICWARLSLVGGKYGKELRGDVLLELQVSPGRDLVSALYQTSSRNFVDYHSALQDNKFYRMDFLVDRRYDIEVDGSQHQDGKHVLHDARRDDVHNAKGFVTIRISASDIFKEPAQAFRLVMRRIYMHEQARLKGIVSKYGGEPKDLERLRNVYASGGARKLTQPLVERFDAEDRIARLKTIAGRLNGNG